jgi:hypothetical protein
MRDIRMPFLLQRFSQVVRGNVALQSLGETGLRRLRLAPGLSPGCGLAGLKPGAYIGPDHE